MTNQSDQIIEAAIFEGRGDHVTAITAILNLNTTPFDFVHLKYPHYNRIIPPGFFKYPYGTTAPINWGAYDGGLIKFGAFGTMWQSDKNVYYKTGGNPAHDTDGEIVYTRQRALPGEQYLILGLKGNQLRTLKSYTPGEALFANLSDAVLSALNVIRPGDYAHLLQCSRPVNTFINRIKIANDAGLLKDLEPRTIDALSKISYQNFNNQIMKLTDEQRKDFMAAESGNPSGLGIARDVFTGLGIFFGGATPILGIAAGIFTGVAAISAIFGPGAWATVTLIFGLLAALCGILAGIAAALTALCVLIAYILDMLDKYLPKEFADQENSLAIAS